MKIEMITVRINVRKLKFVARTFLAMSAISSFVCLFCIFKGFDGVANVTGLMFMIFGGIWSVIDPEHTIIKDFRDRGREIREFINSRKRKEG